MYPILSFHKTLQCCVQMYKQFGDLILGGRKLLNSTKIQQLRAHKTRKIMII